MIIPQVIYASLCILFAYFNAQWIKADKPISHNWNAIAHVIAWALAVLIFDWRVVFVMPFIGKLFFDTALNIFRKLPLNYTTSWGKRSKLDKIELEVFDNPLLAKLVYLLIIIIFNMFIWYGQ